MGGITGCRVRVRGIVQGVGFRPFVFHLARQHALAGSVVNSLAGVDIVIEGPPEAIEEFVCDLQSRAPAAASISEIAAEPLEPSGLVGFRIGESQRNGRRSAQISPDLPVCEECVRELFDPHDRRYRYPYINCIDCGPRFSLATALPYDRETTTMAPWPMCAACDREFNDPSSRRFHAQAIACPECGPAYTLHRGQAAAGGHEAITEAARLLAGGAVLAVKGVGGYHLACDARNAAAVGELRNRKFRKAKAFALMVPDLRTARTLVDVSGGTGELLMSAGRPIVLAPARVEMEGIAPGHPTLGVMLPYAPLHYLLFAAGAPEALVMTSGNRSSEPIAIDEDDAERRLSGIADAFLVGARPIARRVDDSVAQATSRGAAIVRRSRGYAPAVVARLPAAEPILALGGDLKNAIALALGGEVIVSQHIGDLAYHETRAAFGRTIQDLLDFYGIDRSRLTIAHDLHPEYASAAHARAMAAGRHVAVQHHRAHVASVLAERRALATRVVGVAFDGTGWGDDGTIWGGEFLVGSVAAGFERVAHLRTAALPGGDAAATFPWQAAAGFVAQLDDVPDVTQPPFGLPLRYRHAERLVERGIRTFSTTSAGRLFDAVAALLGFTEGVTFEAQAAIWLENIATATTAAAPVEVPFAWSPGELDWRPALRAAIDARAAGHDAAAVALGFHRGLAEGVARAAAILCEAHQVQTVVLSGGVFQNRLLLGMVDDLLAAHGVTVWTNQAVPAGDGGLSLGQAAIASSCVR